jgi:hypothetical protein
MHGELFRFEDICNKHKSPSDCTFSKISVINHIPFFHHLTPSNNTQCGPDVKLFSISSSDEG